MKILVGGGTGFVGRCLVSRLVADGHAVTVLTRGTPGADDTDVAHLQADPTEPGTWQASVADHDAVVNLAGASVGEGRWTDARKRVLRSSRVRTTRHLVEALRPGSGTTLISASAVGYYGDRGDEELTETATPARPAAVNRTAGDGIHPSAPSRAVVAARKETAQPRRAAISQVCTV